MTHPSFLISKEFIDTNFLLSILKWTTGSSPTQLLGNTNSNQGHGLAIANDMSDHHSLTQVILSNTNLKQGHGHGANWHIPSRKMDETIVIIGY